MPFGPSLEGRAFLLQRERGNLLVYSSPTLEPDATAIEELGGIARQYLNHRREAAPICDWVRATFGASLHCHETSAPPSRRRAPSTRPSPSGTWSTATSR